MKINVKSTQTEENTIVCGESSVLKSSQWELLQIFNWKKINQGQQKRASRE